MSELSAEVDDRLSLLIETGPDFPEGGNHLCYVTVYDEGEEVATINPPSKPWEHFTKVMVRNIIVKRVDGYSSKEAVDELLESAFEERWDELDDVYGWE